tara:strand:+ start:956 stop:1180 length:225 start_codon:yes stop_codon:yes gene_type:complete
MFQINDKLKTSLLVLLIVSYVIYENKPSFMFKSDGSFKEFGVNPDQTPFPFFMVVSIVAFTTYYGLLLNEGKYI